MLESSISYIALEQFYLSFQDQEATEAYNFIYKLFDIFSRLISNVKTSLLNFNKKFKRSELRFYHDSKPYAIKNLLDKKYFDRDLMVPIPSGMKVPYITAVEVIDKLFKQLNIESTTDILLSYLKSHSTESPDVITKKISNLTKSELEKELRGVFSSEKTQEVSLSKVIKDLQELKQVDTKILEYENIFKQIPIICEKLDLIEKEIDTIVTNLENKKEDLDRSYVKSLHLLVRTAANQMDFLGVIIAEQQRVEHNFVLVLEKLVKAAM